LKSVGSHLLLELYGCPTALLDNKTYVLKVVREAVSRAGCTLIGDLSHQFHPQGVTAIALLSESHISVHTWPELGYAAADAFTCGDVAQPEKACEWLIDALQAKTHSLRRLARGVEISPPSAGKVATYGNNIQAAPFASQPPPNIDEKKSPVATPQAD